MGTFSIILISVIVFIIFFILTYTVVEPNKAHIVVIMGKGRKVYSPQPLHTQSGDDIAGKTSYFFIPFLMQRIVLPLTNVKMKIDKFELKDEKVAPFMCEVACWFRIKTPETAVEKLDILEDGFEMAVKETLEEQIRGIARAAAMKQELLPIMRDRKTFADNVEHEVNDALIEWGLELVKLEVIDFHDVEGSAVIQDYENIRKATINSKSRQEVAIKDKEADIVEFENEKEANVVEARTTKETEEANIAKQLAVDVAKVKAEAEIAIKTELANKQKVEALRTQKVGEAEVEKEAVIKTAEGLAQAEERNGMATAKVIELEGTAEAQVIESKGLAEAKAIDKKADALTKYNAAGIELEKIKASMKVEISKYDNLGKALANADVNLVGGADGNNILGFDMGSKGGANLGQMIKSFENVSGSKLGDVLNKAKDFIKGNNTQPDQEAPTK